MSGNDSSKSLLERAYDIQAPDQAQALYRDWAASYEQDMVQPLGYVGPARIAEIAAQASGNQNHHVLDVGCGTGLVGQQLHRLGFNALDGLDFSQAMLEQAHKKGIYQSLIQADLNAPLNVRSESYDLLVSCGTFTHGHVGPNAFDELLRITRTGGLLCLSINAAIYESDGFAAKLRAWDEVGKISVRSAEKVTLVAEENIDGLVALFVKQS